MNEFKHNVLRLGCALVGSALLVLGVAPRHLAGQAPLVEHRMPFGTAISLPAGWRSDSVPGLTELVERFYAWAPALTDERVQQLVAGFQRTPLLRARNASRLVDQAIVVFTPLPGFQVQEFESGAQGQSASLAASHCDAYRSIVEGARGSLSCDRHELRHIDGRPAVVVHGTMRIDASGIDNRRTVVLMPIEGGLLTFTVTVHRTEADTLVGERLIGTIRAPSRPK